MLPYFAISDSHDDPLDPDTWTFETTSRPERYTSLDEAFRAAVARAAQLARDPASTAHAVGITMDLEGQGGMRVADVHVWWDHGPELPFIPTLAEHLASGTSAQQTCMDDCQ